MLRDLVPDPRIRLVNAADRMELQPESATTAVPFDMVVIYDLDRSCLAIDVIERVSRSGSQVVHAEQELRDQRIAHTQFTVERGRDMPEVADRTWEVSRSC